jgi:glyoxylase-like metal-dependent hydrolase (beta-lactamase superfamily II)
VRTVLFPLRAPNPGPMTLTGTNTYVLGATDRAWIIDPGPKIAAHLDAVVDSLRNAAGGYLQVEGILVTHHHADHAAGAGTLQRLLEAYTGHLPAVHAADPSLVPGSRPLPRALAADGERIGTIIPLPGHTADSIGVLDVEGRLLTGDTVLGGSSTVIMDPDGVLADYLRSIELLRVMAIDGKVREIHPGHGEPVRGADVIAAMLKELLDHRRRRLDQVREARRRGAMSLRQLRRAIYADVPEDREAAIEAILRAQLAYLRAHPDETPRRP